MVEMIGDNTSTLVCQGVALKSGSLPLLGLWQYQSPNTLKMAIILIDFIVGILVIMLIISIIHNVFRLIELFGSSVI